MTYFEIYGDAAQLDGGGVMLVFFSSACCYFQY